MKDPKRVLLDFTDAKAICIGETTHRQIKIDYKEFQRFTSFGDRVYVINKEGVFFFINNRDNDGMDWVKITSDVENKF